MPEDREELVRAVREGRRVLSVETFHKKVESRGGENKSKLAGFGG